MRRLAFFGLLCMTLAACTVTVEPNRVKVNPETATVKPGAQVALTADLNFETTSRILWSAGSNDPRGPGAGLSNDTGRTTVYTAPMQDGTYTVTAKLLDGEIALSGSSKITVDSFLGADQITANTDRQQQILTGSLPAGGSKLLALVVPSEVANSGEALYIELDQNLKLSVYDNDRTRYATSTSSAYFSKSDVITAAQPSTQAIGIATQCRGACVIRDALADTYYLRIDNTSSASVTYTLYAAVQDYDDAGEFANNTVGGAVSLSGTDTGALESLGDIDYYRSSVRGNVSFTSASTLAPQAEIRASDGTVLATLAPGQAYDRLTVNDTIKVFAGNERAAAAAQSKYTLTVTP